MSAKSKIMTRKRAEMPSANAMGQRRMARMTAVVLAVGLTRRLSKSDGRYRLKGVLRRGLAPY